MSIDTPTLALKNQLDKAPPGQLADYLRSIRIGTTIRQGKFTLGRQVPAVNSYNLATVLGLSLREDARACRILHAYARAGGVTGQLVESVVGATPTTGQIAVSPNGDIVTLGTDAITDLDVTYEVQPGDVVEFTGVPATGVLALPSALTASPRGVLLLIEAEALTGAVVGKKIVLVPAAGLPATTQARLDVAKGNVQFNNATDAVTSARVKLLVLPPAASNPDALLATATTF